MKTFETEKKFLLSYYPQDLNERVEIAQAYLNMKEHFTQKLLKQKFPEKDLSLYSEARIRSKAKENHVEYWLTIKGDGGETRLESEVAITQEEFDLLFKSEVVLGSLEKDRSEQPLVVLPKSAEIDIYTNCFRGLVIAELEYDPNVYPGELIIESMVRKLGKTGPIIDVTQEKAFKNNNLALLRGGIEKLKANVSSLQRKFIEKVQQQIEEIEQSKKALVSQDQ